MNFSVKSVKLIFVVSLFICVLFSCFWGWEQNPPDMESPQTFETDPPYFYEDPDEEGTCSNNVKEKAETEEEEFILNVRSKKIHKLTCGTAGLILPENRENYTGRIEDLYEIGYTQCGNCFK